jgi:galactose mutarotase-like enzyme
MNRARATADETEMEQSRTGLASARILENALIRVEVVPARGGKFISLYSKRTATEWLLPPLRSYAEAKTTGGFEEWDGGGFDECLPTVAATNTAPDHGEVWRHAWQQAPAESVVVLRTTALGGTVDFERRAHLDGASLVLDYIVESRAVENRSQTPQSLIYSAHPLLRVEQGDRILLPAEVRDVVVEGSAGDRLGRRGDRVEWPRPKVGEDLSVLGPPDGSRADKVFAGPVTDGWCALVRPSIDEGVELTFSSDVLPYLGLWICRAAWPDSGAKKQYTVAFEPTGSPHDSLADAEREGTAWLLAPGERREWRLRFRIGTQSQLGENAQRGRAHDRG